MPATNDEITPETTEGDELSDERPEEDGVLVEDEPADEEADPDLDEYGEEV